MANIFVVISQDEDERIVDYLADQYNVVGRGTSFKKASDDIRAGNIVPEIVWLSEYAEKEGKSLLDSVRELKDNLTQVTKIILLLGAQRSSENEFLRALEEMGIDYYLVEEYTDSQIRTWIETAKNDLPALIWVLEENDHDAEVIFSEVPNVVSKKKFFLDCRLERQEALFSMLHHRIPDVILIGNAQGQYSTEDLVDHINKRTESKAKIILMLKEELRIKGYEKQMKKKGVEVHYIPQNIPQTLTEPDRQEQENSEKEIAEKELEEEKPELSDFIDGKRKSAAALFLRVGSIIPKKEVSTSKRQIKKSIGDEEISFLGTISIAICGSDRGVGCTHLAMTMAQFLAARKFATAYVESSNENEVMYSTLSGSRYKEIDGTKGFKFNDYLDILISQDHIYTKGYQYIIHDLGRLEMASAQEKRSELNRAQIPIIVATGNAWSITKMIKTVQREKINFLPVINFVRKEDQKEIFTELKEILSVKPIIYPYLPNMFVYNPAGDEHIDMIIGRCLPKKKRKGFY